MKTDLQYDISLVRAFLKGSKYPEWPEPTRDDMEGRYVPFKAFERICDLLEKGD